AQAGFRVRALRPTVAWLGLAPVAFLGWAYELYRVSGDPLMVLHAHAAWDQRFTPPWETLLRYLQHPGRNDTVLDLAFTVALAVLVVAAWRLLRSSYALLATALFLGVVSRGSLVSMPRYALELFPLFVVLALAGRRWAAFHRGYVALSLGLGSLFMVLFASATGSPEQRQRSTPRRAWAPPAGFEPATLCLEGRSVYALCFPGKQSSRKPSS